MANQESKPEPRRWKIPWTYVGLGVLAFLWLKRNQIPWRLLPPNMRLEYAMQPTQGKARQLASLQTYRLVEGRRSGMTYAPVTSEEGGSLVFTMPKDGTVTRNVVVEGNRKYVEIA